MPQHDTELIDRIWSQFRGVEELLDSEDDPELWRVVLGQILADAQYLASNNRDKKITVFAHIGRCSHWLRPHQTRWITAADGRFAAPIGYGGSGYSRRGLPEFDWSLKWQWEREQEKWIPTLKPAGKRRLEFRVAIPSRTRRHQQAAVHTIWRPGTPAAPGEKAVQFYGFRQTDSAWQQTAYWCSSETLYEMQRNGS